MENKPYSYSRIPDGEYRKALGQFRLAVGVALKPLRMYGQGEIADSAHEVIVELAEQFAMRVRGKEQPIILPPGFNGGPDD